jgi:hypothetical protein
MTDLVLKTQWSNLDRRFRETRDNLKVCRREFEAEVALASAQANKARHQEIMAKLPAGSISTFGEPITTGLLPRNPLFVGRESVMTDLEAFLRPGSPSDLSKPRPRQSCTIHGLGGMGKTQTALEYTYRYRQCYSHIFWLRANDENALVESFLSMMRKLDIETEGANLDKKLEDGKEWLGACCKCASWFSYCKLFIILTQPRIL